MTDQTPDPWKDELRRNADEAVRDYYVHCDQLERDEAAKLPPIPDVVTAIEASTLTPPMVIEWAFHPMVSTSTLERECFACLDRALAAERAQHQQEIEKRDGDFEAVLAAVDAERNDWRDEVAQRDETIRHRRDTEINDATLTTALQGLLKFQYEHRGMGTYACRSCGALAHVDDEGVREHRESCSPSCPWQVARTALESHAQSK